MYNSVLKMTFPRLGMFCNDQKFDKSFMKNLKWSGATCEQILQKGFPLREYTCNKTGICAITLLSQGHSHSALIHALKDSDLPNSISAQRWSLKVLVTSTSAPVTTECLSFDAIYICHITPLGKLDYIAFQKSSTAPRVVGCTTIDRRKQNPWRWFPGMHGTDIGTQSYSR